MKVVVDNNLPRSVSRLLAESGLGAVHVGELGLSQASDQTLRQRFAGESVIFVSRDEDFWSQHPPRWAVVWIALHNPTLAQLKGPICRRLSQFLPALRPGQRVLLANDQIKIFGAL